MHSPIKECVPKSDPTTRPPFTLVVITKNAAHQLAACLGSVPFADEMLVVDSGSDDGTVALAQSMGARVIHQDWLGYGRQKQFAVEQASHDWVLCLDADERLSPELAQQIPFALENSQYSAWKFPRCNRFMGRYLRYGEGYPDWSLRLFDRRIGRWSFDPVHEKVLLQDKTSLGILKADLLHDSADTLSSYLAKQNTYTTLAAEQAMVMGKKPRWGQLLFSPLLRFFKFYVIKQGFRDGLPGLIHICIGCFNSFSKYAKIIELKSECRSGV